MAPDVDGEIGWRNRCTGMLREWDFHPTFCALLLLCLLLTVRGVPLALTVAAGCVSRSGLALVRACGCLWGAGTIKFLRHPASKHTRLVMRQDETRKCFLNHMVRQWESGAL